MYVGYINTIHKRCVVLDQHRAGNDLAWWRVGTWCLVTWRHISSSNKIQKKLLVFICSKYPASCHGTSTFNLHSCHPWIWSAAVKLLVCSLPSFNRFIAHSVHHKSGYLTVLITFELVLLKMHYKIFPNCALSCHLLLGQQLLTWEC